MKNYSEKKGNRNLEDIDTAMPKKKGKGIYGGWC